MIDWCRGNACFEELAAAFATRSSNQLERVIDDRNPGLSADGKPMWSGKYRKWLQEGALPNDDTVEKAYEKSGGKTHLKYWRDLLLWTLAMEPFPLTLTQLHEGLTTLNAPVRNIIFLAVQPDIHGRYKRHNIPREEVIKLKNLGTLDAFMGMLGLAREGDLISEDQRHAFPSLCAHQMFPEIIVRHPHLEACWEQLYACLHLPFWSRIYLGNFHGGYKIDDARRQINELKSNLSNLHVQHVECCRSVLASGSD